MSKDYRDTEYCPGYGNILEDKKIFMDSFRTQHPRAKDIHAYVSKNEGNLQWKVCLLWYFDKNHSKDNV